MRGLLGSQLRGEQVARTVDRTEPCSPEQPTARTGFRQSQRTPRAAHIHAAWRAAGWENSWDRFPKHRTLELPLSPGDGGEDTTPPPPRWRWHPLPQSLHTLSYLEERFPIYGLQSRHATLLLVLGREDRGPCHWFYTANCC